METTTTEKMNRLAGLLKGRVVENAVILAGRFDQVRAERIAERNGCTLRYVTRKQWQRNSSGWASYLETLYTRFEFPA